MKMRERFGIEEHGCNSSPNVPDSYQSRDDCNGARGQAGLRWSLYSASLLDTKSSDSQRAIWVCNAIIRAVTWNKAKMPGPEPQNAGSAFVHSASQHLKKFYFHIGPCFNVSAWLQGEKQYKTLQWSDFTGKLHWPPGQSSTLIPQGKASLRAIFHLGCPWPI